MKHVVNRIEANAELESGDTVYTCFQPNHPISHAYGTMYIGHLKNAISKN